MQRERGDGDRRNVPEIERHRSPVAHRDDVPDPRPLRPTAGSARRRRRTRTTSRVQCSASNSVGGETLDMRSVPVTTSETSYGPTTASTTCAANAHAAHGKRRRGHRSAGVRRPPRSRRGSARRSRSWRRPAWGVPAAIRIASTTAAAASRAARPRRRPRAPCACRVSAGTKASTTRYTPRNHSSATHSRPSPAAESAPRIIARHEETDRPCREVPEHRPAQSLRPGEQPCAPRRARAPAVCARGAACEEEQRHDLHDPRDRGDRGHLAEQVADPQTAGVDRGEQQRAVPEHHDHQGGEPGDVDGAVAVGRGLGGDLASDTDLVSVMTSRMPGIRDARMSSTTRQSSRVTLVTIVRFARKSAPPDRARTYPALRA